MCMRQLSNLKIAIVHDSLRYFGGVERALISLTKIFPKATVFTSTVAWNKLGIYKNTIRDLNPYTTWVQQIPFFPSYPYLYRYLLPFIWSSLDLTKYDIVISNSYAQMSHLVKVKADSLHICYSHSPPRHLYGYETDFDWQKNFYIREPAKVLNAWLRRIDFTAAQKVDFFIAASKEVAGRIKRFYNRESYVIYPPCIYSHKNNNHNNITSKSIMLPNRYFLIVSRLSRRKRIDTVIKAFNKLKQNLVIVGVGPEENYLKQISGPNVYFLGLIKDELPELYKGSVAVICTSPDEDFGIVPVEAMSFGKPVIALHSGGYKETVINNTTGLLLYSLNQTEIINAVKKIRLLQTDRNIYIKQAKKFSEKVFAEEMSKFINEEIKLHFY